MKKKLFKIMALVIALAIFAGAIMYVNAIFGNRNPLSKALATKSMKEHLYEKYAGTDYYIEELTFDAENSDYLAHVKSESSADTYFTISCNMFGRYSSDNYEERVLAGMNTGQRLNMEYRTLMDTVLESPKLQYMSDTSFGELMFYEIFEGNKVLHTRYLELDGIYDMAELGADFGKLALYAEHEDVTAEHAAEILLEVKTACEEAGTPFYRIDLHLCEPAPEDTEEGLSNNIEHIDIEKFLWDDIYEEDLTERVQVAYEKYLRNHGEKQGSDAGTDIYAGVDPEIIAMVESMDIVDKIEQLFIVRIESLGGYLAPWKINSPDTHGYTAFNYGMRRSIQNHPPGGVILFDKNIDDAEQLAKLTAQIEENAKIPMLIIIAEDGEIEYDGVVVSDPLIADTVINGHTSAESAVIALQEGADLLLLPYDFDDATSGIFHAWLEGEITEERIDESLIKILELKKELGLI